MAKIYIASDHAGFELKNALIPYIGTIQPPEGQKAHEVEDLGAITLDTEDDYPTYIRPCAEKVAQEEGSFGIVIGGSGQGEAMVANREKGVRAAEFYGGTMEIVRLAREHNDANILSLGARFVSEDEAKEAVRTFLETPFSDAARHARRIAEF